MKDYSQTKMYKLISKNTDKVYYGHSTITLKERLRLHVSDASRPHKPCTSKEIIDAGDYEIVLLEDYPCANKKEAHTRERWWIENHPCVNKYIPCRTKKEYNADNKERIEVVRKLYVKKNADKIKQYHQQNYVKNKEHIQAVRNVYVKKNADKIKQYHQQNYVKNKIQIDTRNKEWNKNNAERCKEVNKAYKVQNKEKLAEQGKQNYLWHKSWGADKSKRTQCKGLNQIAIDLFD